MAVDIFSAPRIPAFLHTLIALEYTREPSVFSNPSYPATRLLFIHNCFLLSSAVLMPQNALGSLAFPGVVALISFLAYGSQILFRHIEPYALEQKQVFIFNALVGCIWITYTQACFTNPGWTPPAQNLYHSNSEQSPSSNKTPRWCRKCKALKPPRAHHCKICQR